MDIPTSHVVRLLETVAGVSSNADLNPALRRIVCEACDLADASFGAVAIFDQGSLDPNNIKEFVAHHRAAGSREICRRPWRRGVLSILQDGSTVLDQADLADGSRDPGLPPGHPAVQSLVGAAVRREDKIAGALYVANKRSGQPFSVGDREVMVALAGTAALAVGDAQRHAQADRLHVAESRARAARDIYDGVIQRLFSTGLSIQGLTRLADRPDMVARLQTLADEIDSTIRDIRGSIFAMQGPQCGSNSPRVLILALVNELGQQTGVTTTVQFDGPVDVVMADDLCRDLLATISDLIGDCAAHDPVGPVDLVVSTSHGIVLRLTDPGGDPLTASVSPLIAAARARAEYHHGRRRLTGRDSGGVVVEWQVPCRWSQPE